MIICSRSSLLGIFLFLPGIIRAQDRKIIYTLSMPNPQTHYFNVTIVMQPSGDGFAEFKMPAWAPGSYLIRDFAKNVIQVSAMDEKSIPLKIEKTDKGTWKVYSPNAQKIEFHYKVYAFELSVRTSYLDDNQAYITGSSVFMFPAGQQDYPAELKIIAPESWKKISTGLDPDPEQKWKFQASNYDQLTDCPIEIGNHLTFSFTASGVMHEVALVGPGNFDVEQMKKDMTVIVDACTEIFGENPNKRYVFIIHNVEKGGGGLEHGNSTSLMVNRWSYQPENSYAGFLGLVAHEYLHLWLVKRLRPASLVNYDYMSENYTDLLWVMEGFPSYYDDMLLCRLGYISEDDYLRRLSGAINNIENTPGNQVQTVSGASYDAWIKEYKPDENQSNSTITYYTKGNELAALIDLEVINSTDGKKSLNDLLSYLYVEYYKKKNTGITQEDFRKAFESLTGRNEEKFFKDYINGSKQIEYTGFFKPAGIDVYNSLEGDQSAFAGMSVQDSEGKSIIRNVFTGGSAQKACLSPGDEILGIDHFRLSQEDIINYIRQKQVGDTLEMLVARDGIISVKKMPMLPGERRQYNLFKMTDQTDHQKIVYKKWIRGK
jgi:predicted metalloprotease with PDZ domain